MCIEQLNGDFYNDISKWFDVVIYLKYYYLTNYYFIGKFETLDADIALAFKYIGIDGIVKFPQRKTFYKKTKSSDISEQYFNEVPKYYLRKLWKTYCHYETFYLYMQTKFFQMGLEQKYFFCKFWATRTTL
jgi:hypothetical protein